MPTVKFKAKGKTVSFAFGRKKGRKKKSAFRVKRKPGTKLWRVMRGPIVVGLTETKKQALRLRDELES